MTDLVKAYWNCHWPTEIAGQGTLGFGDAAMVPKAEADASEHWRLASPSRTARSASPDEIDTPPAPDGNAAITADKES